MDAIWVAVSPAEGAVPEVPVPAEPLVVVLAVVPVSVVVPLAVVSVPVDGVVVVAEPVPVEPLAMVSVPVVAVPVVPLAVVSVPVDGVVVVAVPVVVPEPLAPAVVVWQSVRTLACCSGVNEAQPVLNSSWVFSVPAFGSLKKAPLMVESQLGMPELIPVDGVVVVPAVPVVVSVVV
jgi:hypothetical protein